MALNPDSVMTGIWKLVGADATLSSASYLDGSDKIWKGGLRPRQDEHPLVTLEGVRKLDPYTDLELWEVTATVYSDTLHNDTADTARIGRIAARISELVCGQTITVENGEIFGGYQTADSGSFDTSTKKSSDRKMEFKMYAREI